MKNQITARISTFCLLVSLGLSIALVTKLTGCSTHSDDQNYGRTTGEYIDDQTLTLRVEAALNENPDYKFTDVSVSTMQGTVQLSGFVNTGDQKSKAVEIAKDVEGVKHVQDKISVKPLQ